MTDVSPAELTGLAALGALGSVCTILLRSSHKNLESLEQMRDDANNVIRDLRAELRDNDEAISKLQALCATSHRRYAVYRYHIGALRAERKQLKLEVERLKAAPPMTNQFQEGNQNAK